MSLTEDQQKFLKSMEISPTRFEKLERDIQILIDIAQDYEIHKNDLLDVASYIANRLQRCEGVHTVRSRIKDTSHLIEKIIRKWECEKVAEKYDTISKNSYKSIIDDLIGVRAIYLFKKDWEVVHTHIVTKWEQQEEVKIYHRNGDDLTKYHDYKDCIIQEHGKGYRSVHYIIPAIKIDGQQVNCEIQTRTIFEEGWSEIDHKVRYPSFSDNLYLQEFLDIFNRISGSADEMGSFVNSLRELIEVNKLLEENKELIVQVHEKEIRNYEEKIEKLFKEKAKLQDIEAAYHSLKAAKELKEQVEQQKVAAIKNLNSEATSTKGMASLLGVDPQLLSSALGLNTQRVMESALGLNTKKAAESVLGLNTQRALESALGINTQREIAESLGLTGVVDRYKKTDDDQ
ncbi:hypothetical protein [Acinetobacter junii]|uniref:hypothetical protein n=2 Tax=Acinetobacter TaxID=469 RepID=UPI003AF536F3